MRLNKQNYDKSIEKLKKKLRPLNVEHIMLVDINEFGCPEHWITLAKGTERKCNLQYYKITSNFRKYNPKGIIIAHNHPGNLPFPSESDTELTIDVCQICKNNNVRLIDHVIILKDYDSYFSFSKRKYYANKVGICYRKN